VSDVKPEKTATGPQLADIFLGQNDSNLLCHEASKMFLTLSKRLIISRVFAGLNSYEYFTGSSALQSTAKTCNCVPAQWWNCAVCGIPETHSSRPPRDL